MTTETKLIASAVALLGGIGVITVVSSQNPGILKTPTETNTAIHKAKTTNSKTTTTFTTKTITSTEAIPFETKTYNDPSLPAGKQRIDVYGRNGVITNTYEITYSNGVETKHRLLSSKRTAEPITQVVAIGTYIAPSQPECPNGSYINSAGNTVCRPSSTNNGTATAICRDGTYSYSQSRSGTCSGHKGVAQWL